MYEYEVRLTNGEIEFIYGYDRADALRRRPGIEIAEELSFEYVD